MKEEDWHAHPASILNSTEDAVVSVDLARIVVSWNRGAESLLGYPPNEIIGRPVDLILPPARKEEALRVLDRVFRGETAPSYESERVTRDGRLIPVSLTVSPLRNATGQILGACAITRNQSALQLAYAALKESEAQLREAQRIGHVGSWKWDLQTNSTVWSEELYRIFGEDHRLPARPFTAHSAVVGPNAQNELRALERTALKTGAPYEYDLKFQRPDGQTRWVAIRGWVDCNGGDKATGLRGTAHDITERKRQAEALSAMNESLERMVAERNAELQAVLDAAPIPIWISQGRDGTRVIGNPCANRILGKAVPQSEASRVGPGPQPRPEEWPGRMAAATGEVVVDQEVDLLLSDGQSVNLLLSAAPLLDANGEVRGSVTAGVDLTGLRAAERARDSILDSLPSSIAVIGPDGQILTTNGMWNRFERSERRPRSSAGPGANYLKACRKAADAGSNDAKAALEGIQDVLAGRLESFELEYPCHSPTRQHWFLMKVLPLRNGAKGAVVAHTEITERVLAEQALRTSESKIRGLLDSSSQSVVAVNAAGEITIATGSTDAMFGYQRDELIGQKLDVLIPTASRAKHAAHRKAYLQTPQNRSMAGGLELEGLRKDGSTFPVEVGLSTIETASGRLAVAFISDITIRRKLEAAERAYARDVQSLAAGLLTAQEEERRRVSRDLHDTLCQELASLSIEAGSLARKFSLEDEARARIHSLQARVVEIAEHARHIAYELHSPVLDDLGLEDSLRELCEQFHGWGSKTALAFSLSAPPPDIPRGVASCIHRVAQESLRNIFKHAQASHASLEVHVRKDGLELTVADDGCGFDRTASKGPGHLGLIGMEERARLAGGLLKVTSHPGRGTLVSLHFPRSIA